MEILEHDNTLVYCLGCKVKHVDLIPYILCEVIILCKSQLGKSSRNHETIFIYQMSLLGS